MRLLFDGRAISRAGLAFLAGSWPLVMASSGDVPGAAAARANPLFGSLDEPLAVAGVTGGSLDEGAGPARHQFLREYEPVAALMIGTGLELCRIEHGGLL